MRIPIPTLGHARAVFDHAPMGMAVLDDTGAFTQTNHALQRLLGLEPDDLLGQSLETIVDAGDRDTVVTTLEALLTQGKTSKVDLRFTPRGKGTR